MCGRLGLTKVPWWVSRSLYCSQKLESDLRTSNAELCLPRVQQITDIRVSVKRRCHLPVVAQESLRLIDTAIMELMSFWHSFAKEFQQYCLGDKGVSTEMQDIFSAMATAWWLPDVMEAPAPSERHMDALKRLYSHLKQDLQLKPWPPQEYNMTPAFRQWPKMTGLLHYYEIWWNKAKRRNQDRSSCGLPHLLYVSVNPGSFSSCGVSHFVTMWSFGNLDGHILNFVLWAVPSRSSSGLHCCACAHQ